VIILPAQLLLSDKLDRVDCDGLAATVAALEVFETV
jgi:hypothetical protein